MRNRTMEDYLERVHAENERLRKIIDDQSDAYDGVAYSAITYESAMRWWRKRARKYSLENVELRLALEKAVRDYGQPGGPWNVPGEPGTWLHMAKQALGVE